MCFMLRIPCVSVRDLWFVSEQRKIIHIWICIYIRTSVLLCMYMDRESGSNSEVDPIVTSGPGRGPSVPDAVRPGRGPSVPDAAHFLHRNQ